MALKSTVKTHLQLLQVPGHAFPVWCDVSANAAAGGLNRQPSLHRQMASNMFTLLGLTANS